MLRVYYKHYEKYITNVNHVKRQRKNGNSFGWDRALEVSGGGDENCAVRPGPNLKNIMIIFYAII